MYKTVCKDTTFFLKVNASAPADSSVFTHFKFFRALHSHHHGQNANCALQLSGRRAPPEAQRPGRADKSAPVADPVRVLWPSGQNEQSSQKN